MTARKTDARIYEPTKPMPSAFPTMIMPSKPSSDDEKAKALDYLEKTGNADLAWMLGL